MGCGFKHGTTHSVTKTTLANFGDKETPNKFYLQARGLHDTFTLDFLQSLKIELRNRNAVKILSGQIEKASHVAHQKITG